jgi:hypothetical protein
MIIDECCFAVMQRLKACIDPIRSREIIAEADSFLEAAALSDHEQQTFWQKLHRELNVVAHQLSRPLDGNVVRARAVVAAAQAAIADHQRQRESKRFTSQN